MKKTNYFFLSLILIILVSVLIGCKTEKVLIADGSELIGFWKTEQQYTLDLETKEWGAGLVERDELGKEIKTSILKEPVYVEIRKPLPEDKCPEGDSKNNYLVLSDNCYLVIENQLQLFSKEGKKENYFADWSLQNNTLEMVHNFIDPSKKLIPSGISISKTISKKVTEEEAKVHLEKEELKK